MCPFLKFIELKSGIFILITKTALKNHFISVCSYQICFSGCLIDSAMSSNVSNVTEHVTVPSSEHVAEIIGKNYLDVDNV
jgi:hypothetical protein